MHLASTLMLLIRLGDAGFAETILILKPKFSKFWQETSYRIKKEGK